MRESGEPPPTDFAALDVLGDTPAPSTSVDVCMSSGFQLNNGARTTDGSGVLLVGGEAFRWRPWLSNPNNGLHLINGKGQFHIPTSTLGLLSLVWPRPDLFILGLGPEMRPISPELRKAISAMGMRVEVLDTRNAAAQFNLLATERGVDDVAAALVPIGWKEGVGAGKGDAPDITHE
jgi:NADH dehydrogenase [ubiquinone] 1 alpha subcomplex assembly factor 3